MSVVTIFHATPLITASAGTTVSKKLRERRLLGRHVEEAKGQPSKRTGSDPYWYWAAQSIKSARCFGLMTLGLLGTLLSKLDLATPWRVEMS